MPELRPAFPQGDARNAILEAALAVFAAEGFHGAGTRQIARAAGVSQPLLNHHFGGKEALWRRVGEQITADFMAFMTEAVDLALPPGDGVTAMLRAYLAFWKADHYRSGSTSGDDWTACRMNAYPVPSR